MCLLPARKARTNPIKLSTKTATPRPPPLLHMAHCDCNLIFIILKMYYDYSNVICLNFELFYTFSLLPEGDSININNFIAYFLGQFLFVDQKLGLSFKFL